MHFFMICKSLHQNPFLKFFKQRTDILLKANQKMTYTIFLLIINSVKLNLICDHIKIFTPNFLF